MLYKLDKIQNGLILPKKQRRIASAGNCLDKLNNLSVSTSSRWPRLHPCLNHSRTWPIADCSKPSFSRNHEMSDQSYIWRCLPNTESTEISVVGLGCRDRACVTWALRGECPQLGVFLRDPSPYLRNFRRKPLQTSNGQVNMCDGELNLAPPIYYQFWKQNRSATGGVWNKRK